MRLLLVEDDRKIAGDISAALTQAGYAVDIASDGEKAWFLGDTEDYDLVILDIGLPSMDGLSVLKRWRANDRHMPVLMLTARGSWAERVEGIDAGADDYLPKPFNPRELLARIKAILRRTAEAEQDDVVELAVGPLRAHMQRREAFLDEEPLRLTNAEFVILATLMRAPGDVVSRETLTRTALGRRLLPDDRSLDTHISNLRKKLGQDDDERIQIRSVRGSGYVLVPPTD